MPILNPLSPLIKESTFVHGREVTPYRNRASAITSDPRGSIGEGGRLPPLPPACYTAFSALPAIRAMGIISYLKIMPETPHK